MTRVSKTFVEARPTPVTVIGWAWIILGGMMLLSASLALIMQIAAPPPELPDDVPFAWFWRNFAVFAVGQVVLSVFGIVAGRRLLKLERWARGALEVASWILLASVLGFLLFWVLNAGALMGGEDGAEAGIEAVFFIVPGVVSTLMYAGPVGVMIYHLRSDRVRSAMI